MTGAEPRTHNSGMSETSDFPVDFSLAVIADAHLHDIEGDYGVAGIQTGSRCLSLRTWDDSRLSTRVFNESAQAFAAALEQVAARGIRHVVLLGDYTDDGQRCITAGVAALLATHAARFGTRFYALPGNHDIFGPTGRHQAKHILQADGSSRLVSSDPAEAAPNHVFNPAMYCEGYPAGLKPMAAFGYFRRPDDLHWESPFGPDDSAASRTYSVASPDGQNRYTLMDASYLVEPEPGLWLLMLDANVFEPRNGTFTHGEAHAFVDSTGAGWNALLRLKPFLLSWMADVAQRAKTQGKTLLAFSHYPAIDPFDMPPGLDEALFPNSTMAKRKPQDAVADALIAAGITVHFSGHLHVEGVTRRQTAKGAVVNVAVPSLVAFPPAFKQVTISGQQVAVQTVNLSDLPMDAQIMALYQQEMTRNGQPPDAALLASTYGNFLRRHTTSLVQHRYFLKEWPQPVAACLATMRVADLCMDARTRPHPDEATALATLCAQTQWDEESLAALPATEIVSDWYCLRQAGALALPALGTQRLALLRGLADVYTQALLPDESDAIRRFLRAFFQAMQHFLNRAEQPADLML